MRFNKVQLILLVVTIMFLSCKPKKNITYRMTDEIRGAIALDEGSYWIFKDSISGLEDSIWTGEYSITVEKLRSDEDGATEFVEYGRLPLYSDTGFVGALHTRTSPTYIGLSGSAFGFNPFPKLFHKPFESNKMISENPYGQFFFIKHYQSINIANVTYLDVYHTYSKYISCLTCTSDTVNRHTYYSPQVGFVKISIENQGNLQVKELIKHTIVK